jgi:adenosine kinase
LVRYRYPFINESTNVILNSDKSILDKYKLKENDAILAEEKHLPIYEDLISNYAVKYLAGGAAQNTARGAQVRLPII